jgi:hypothetical protein
MFSTPLTLKPTAVSLKNKNPLSLPTTHSPTTRRFKVTAMAPPKPGGGKAKKGKFHSLISNLFVFLQINKYAM